MKRFLSEVKQGTRAADVLVVLRSRAHAGCQEGAVGVRAFEQTDNVLDTVKPIALLRRMLQVATVRARRYRSRLLRWERTDRTGSVEQNQRGRRQPQVYSRATSGAAAETGDDITRPSPTSTKERVRRVIKKLSDEDDGKLDFNGGKKQDPRLPGLQAHRIQLQDLERQCSDRRCGALQQQLELHIDHMRDGRTAEDILYEILLKSGFPLDYTGEKVTLAGKTVYSVAGGALFICLERELTLGSHPRDGRAEARARSVPRQRLCQQRPAQGQRRADF